MYKSREIKTAIIRFERAIARTLMHINYFKMPPYKKMPLLLLQLLNMENEEKQEAIVKKNIFEYTSPSYLEALDPQFDLLYVYLNQALIQMFEDPKLGPLTLLNAAYQLTLDREDTKLDLLLNQWIFQMTCLELIHDLNAYQKIQKQIETLIDINRINKGSQNFMNIITDTIINEHLKPSKGLDAWLYYDAQNRVMQIMHDKLKKRENPDIHQPIVVFQEKIKPSDYLIEAPFFKSESNFKEVLGQSINYRLNYLPFLKFQDYYFLPPELIRFYRYRKNERKFPQVKHYQIQDGFYHFYDFQDMVIMQRLGRGKEMCVHCSRILELKPFSVATFRKHPIPKEEDLKKIVESIGFGI